MSDLRDDTILEAIMIIVLAIAFIFFGVIIGIHHERERWKQKTIHKGVAKFNKKNEWVWTVDDKSDN